MGWSAGKVDDVTACRIQDGGYALLWQRYDNKKMAAIFYIFNSTVIDWTCYIVFFLGFSSSIIDGENPFCNNINRIK